MEYWRRTGVPPRQTTDDPAERVLGHWVARQWVAIAEIRQQSGRVSAWYVADADIERWGLLASQTHLALGAIQRKSGLRCIEVHHADVCHPKIVPVRRKPDDDGRERLSAQRLQEVCDELGLGDVWLARTLGVREDTCRRWWTGKEPVPYRVSGELASALREVSAAAARQADRLDVVCQTREC